MRVSTSHEKALPTVSKIFNKSMKHTNKKIPSLLVITAAGGSIVLAVDWLGRNIRCFRVRRIFGLAVITEPLRDNS